MPEENLNEQDNQPQGHPSPESQDQLGQEPQTEELSEFDRVLQELPEDRRKIVEEASMRHKAFTQKTQKFSDDRKRFEQRMSENQNKIDFYNRFRDDDSFRQEVLSSMGAPKKVIKSDDFDEQYVQAQELINDLEPNARKAMGFLIKKQIRDEMKPFKEKVSEFERQQTESQERRAQQVNLERRQVLRDFATEHSDWVGKETEMNEIISDFPGFYEQTPKKLARAIRRVYQQVNLPDVKKKAEEKGIKKILNQNIKAQTVVSKTVSTPSPRKTFDNTNKKLKLGDAFDKIWDEEVGD